MTSSPSPHLLEPLEGRCLFAALVFKSVIPIQTSITSGTTFDQTVVQPDGQIVQAAESANGIYMTRYDATGVAQTTSSPIAQGGATVVLNSVSRSPDGKIAVAYRTFQQVNGSSNQIGPGQVQILTPDLQLLGSPVAIPSTDTDSFALTNGRLYFGQIATIVGVAGNTISLTLTSYAVTATGPATDAISTNVASRTITVEKLDKVDYSIGAYAMEPDQSGGLVVAFADQTRTLGTLSKVVTQDGQKETLVSDPYALKTDGNLYLRRFGADGQATGAPVKLLAPASSGIAFNSIAIATDGSGRNLAVVAGGPTKVDSVPKFTQTKRGSEILSQQWTGPFTTVTRTDVLVASATLSGGKVRAGKVASVYGATAKARGISEAFSNDFINVAVGRDGVATAVYTLKNFTQSSTDFTPTDSGQRTRAAQVTAKGEQPFSPVTLSATQAVGDIRTTDAGDTLVVYNPPSDDDGTVITSIGKIAPPKLSLTLQPVSPAIVNLGKAGARSTVKVLLKDLGELPYTGTVQVKFTLRDATGATRTIGTVVSPSTKVAAGKSTSLALTLSVPAKAAKGDGVLTIQLDPGGKLADADRTDNVLTLAARVG